MAGEIEPTEIPGVPVWTPTTEKREVVTVQGEIDGVPKQRKVLRVVSKFMTVEEVKARLIGLETLKARRLAAAAAVQGGIDDLRAVVTQLEA